MSLLLKHSWRNMVRTSHLCQMLLRAQSFSSQETAVKTVDPVVASLKAARDGGELLSAAQRMLPGMAPRHLLQALHSLFELHRDGKLRESSEDLLKDPVFNMLCQSFKKQARALDAGEALQAVKCLSYLQVPAESLIVQTMLQIIRCEINVLNIRQIMFLDFLLQKFETQNHLVDALRLALPLAFQIHLPVEIDRQDLPLLKEMLMFSCSHHLPDRCINNIVTGLLIHDETIDPKTAKSIVWSLVEVNCTAEVYPTRAKLLYICLDILCHSMDQLNYDDVLKTTARLKRRILDKHPEYYHEKFLDAAASYVVNNNVPFEKALLVARILSRIAHTNLALTEYLCQLAATDSAAISNARTNILFGFINCLANANYTPESEQWTKIRKQISANPILDTHSPALPWVKVSLELASLGHFEDVVLKRVFSEEFLDEHLSRNENKLDYIQLLTLHEAVRTLHSEEYSLPEKVLKKAQDVYPVHTTTVQVAQGLARALAGPEYVAQNVTLPSGMVLDCVLCVRGGHPVRVRGPGAPAPAPAAPVASRLPLEDLKLPPHTQSVCVMNFNQGCFSMNSNRLRGTFCLIVDVLEKKGFAVVALNVTEWMSCPEHERVPYLLREIGHKCGELGMRLSVVA